MAKKDKARGSSARHKLPKEVLGVKVPRELRKAGNRLIEQAQAPATRQAIAGALTAVAGAAVTAALARGTSRAAGAAAPADGDRKETAASPGTPHGTSQGAAPGTDHVEALARFAESFLSNMARRRG